MVVFAVDAVHPTSRGRIGASSPSGERDRRPAVAVPAQRAAARLRAARLTISTHPGDAAVSRAR
jgi:hypothetical protein